MSRLVIQLGGPRTYLLEPVPAPRMDKSASWSSKPGVVKYRAFCKEVRRRGIELPVPFYAEFYLGSDANPEGEPHILKPDADNLLKGLIDAVFYRRKGGDSHVHSFAVTKRWSSESHFRIWPVLGWELIEDG